jgi:hypothetical protein
MTRLVEEAQAALEVSQRFEVLGAMADAEARARRLVRWGYGTSSVSFGGP